MKGKSVDIKDTKEIVQFIVRNLDNAKRIILFGSVAEKEKGNDLDLAIITTSWEGHLKELYYNVGKKICAICQKYPIDYFVIPVNLVEKYRDSPFLKIINTTGRLLYMDKESLNEWILDAKLDYEQSCYLFKGKYYKGACYFAQQSIEKFLKSKLFSFGWELKKAHTVVFLASELKSYGYPLADITDDELAYIDSIYKGGYPGEQGLLPYGNPTENDAERAISIAYRIELAIGRELTQNI
jgi:HEPN domain-containing protein/predicted nucleotidyltransferase